MPTLLRDGIFRALVFVQCVVVIGALCFSRSVHGRAEQLLEVFQFLLLLSVAAYVAWLQRDLRAQVATREETEGELRRERHTLEKRVEVRTAELCAEVSERRRAEQLNRDRNRVLEMLVRDEAAPRILQALTEAVAHRSTSLSCALHLIAGDTLTLAAQSSLPSTLAERLQLIPMRNPDAPECVALGQKSIHAVGELHQAHKPWCELLLANGAQSVWAAPILASGERPLGTISVYSLLMHLPGELEFEFLRASCQLASLILERQRMNEELIHRAYHDPLTGLGNRRLGNKALESAIQRAQRDARGVGVMWIDLTSSRRSTIITAILPVISCSAR